MIVIPVSSLAFPANDIVTLILGTASCLRSSAVSCPSFFSHLSYLHALFHNVWHPLALHPLYFPARSLHSLPLSVFKWSAAHSAVHLLRVILCCLSEQPQGSSVSHCIDIDPDICINIPTPTQKTPIITVSIFSFCTYTTPLKHFSLFWDNIEVYDDSVFNLGLTGKRRWSLPLTENIDTTRTFTTLLCPSAAFVGSRLCLNKC